MSRLFQASFSDEMPDWAIDLAQSGKLAPTASREVLAGAITEERLSQLESAGIIEVLEVAGQDRVRQKSGSLLFPRSGSWAMPG